MSGKSKARGSSHFRLLVLILILLAVLLLLNVEWSKTEVITNVHSSGDVDLNRRQAEMSQLLSVEEEAEEVLRCGWKPNESLAGFCAGNPLSHVKLSGGNGKASAADCSASCCLSKKCVTWQFREDTGCLQGPDVRLGMEKDGPSEWCEPTAPSPWKGEQLTDRHNGLPLEKVKACGDEWNPDSLTGQCFGLGALRPNLNSPDECRTACCADDTCQTWQYRPDKGCFYGGWVGHCEKGNNLGAFIGRRKLMKGRKYTDHSRKIVHPVTIWPGLP